MKFYSLILVFLIFSCSNQEEKSEQSEKSKDKKVSKDSVQTNPTKKEVMVFENWGSLEINEDSLNIYSNLHITSSGSDTTCAKIDPEKGFCINHINSLGGKEFLQFILFLQPSRKDISEAYQFDLEKMDRNERIQIEYQFKKLFQSSVFDFVNYKKILRVQLLEMNGTNAVAFSYIRYAHEYNPDQRLIHCDLITFLNGNNVGSLLIEKNFETLEKHEDLVNEVMKTINI